jgi:hypothetical protein
MIADGHDRRPDDRSRAVQPQMNDPFGFGMFDSMFSNMRNMMSNVHQPIVSVKVYDHVHQQSSWVQNYHQKGP